MSNTQLLKKRAAEMVIMFVPVIDDNNAIIDLLDKYEIKAPSSTTEEGFKNRLLCSDWWFKTLQRQQDRSNEELNINHGYVKKGKEIYCSDVSVNIVQSRKKSSLDILENKVAVSDQGDEFDMLDILETSMANSTNRLAELMVRMSGFEEYAKDVGDVGEFYTLTTPSKYHRYSRGIVNSKHEHNPKEGQNYLVSMWAKIRSKLDRQDIKIYGFRVAEPHHDGTPHWHMLVFMNPANVQSVRQIMHDYATSEEPDELQHHGCCYQDSMEGSRGAPCTVRFDYKQIDYNRGSATGYIAKYIAKNLGFGIGKDSEDSTKDTSEVSQRVQSWASIWGIRQFQQIGGAPVTVWRELRKINTEYIELDQFIESVRAAADESNWSLFISLMGGADAKRVDMTIKLLKKNKIDPETGEIKANKYDEIQDFVFGICSVLHTVITRIKEWTIINKNQLEGEGATSNQPQAALCPPIFPPWSPVNNCTTKVQI